MSIIEKQPAVLFVCTGNACRSQMAERLLRERAGDRFEVLSAGMEPKNDIHPLTRKVMAEAGLPLDGHRPKHLKDLLGRVSVRHLIVVCAEAEARCPSTFPGALTKHDWPFDDPAAIKGSEREKLDAFRRVRDLVSDRIDAWLQTESQTLRATP